MAGPLCRDEVPWAVAHGPHTRLVHELRVHSVVRSPQAHASPVAEEVLQPSGSSPTPASRVPSC